MLLATPLTEVVFVRPLVISGEEIRALASMRDIVDVVEESFRELALGHAALFPRQSMPIGESYARFTNGSAFVGGKINRFATKLLGVNFENPLKRNMASIGGAVVLNDSVSGEIIAIIDGTVLTAVRTGACAGVSARYLARKNADTIGIFGAGRVGTEILRAYCAVRNITKAKITDPPAAEKCRKLCKELSEELGIPVVPASPKEAVVDSDIIGTATNATEPLFDGKWLKNGAHVSTVAVRMGQAREIDLTTVRRAKKPGVVDLKEHVLSEKAQDLLIPIEKGLLSEDDLVNLGDVILGKVSVRTSDRDITLFKTGGLITEDVVAASRIYDLARSKDVGTEVTL